MKRQVFFLIVGSIIALYTQTILAQCNTIDAVTSASFRITGGQACTTFAKLNWTYTRTNGVLLIKWGTSTTYGTQKSVYASNPINITGLMPLTKYYYAVDGTWEGRAYQYTRSSFTTSSRGTAIIPGHTAAESGLIALKIGNSEFAVPAHHNETVAVEFFSLSGTSIGGRYRLTLKDGNGEIGLIRNLSPGVYLARVSWGSGSVQKKIAISR